MKNTKVTIPRSKLVGISNAFSISEAIFDELVDEVHVNSMGMEAVLEVQVRAARKLAQLIEILWDRDAISASQLHSLIAGEVVHASSTPSD